MAPIYIIDSLMNKGTLKFSEACKCYQLIRKGWSAEEALHIINTRKGKKEKKHMKQNKKTESLETLVGLLNNKAIQEQHVWAYGLAFGLCEGLISYDALNHINHKASMELNDPKISEDALDYCYSNTDGVEVMF